LEKRKLDRGMEGVRRVDKCKEGYFLNKGKETAGMCK